MDLNASVNSIDDAFSMGRARPDSALTSLHQYHLRVQVTVFSVQKPPILSWNSSRRPCTIAEDNLHLIQAMMACLLMFESTQLLMSRLTMLVFDNFQCGPMESTAICNA